MITSPTPLDYFRELSQIPRVSGNEKAAADYVEGIARTHGCTVYRDAMDNLIVKKPASPGKEKAPAFMLQGHLDMVGQADAGVHHDFATDPIALVETDGILRAKGTTLGADDGIAVALMLSILSDDTLVHPALECVFTVQEETGLYGVLALDKTLLNARYLLNLDAGPEGIFVASCAGGCRVRMTRPITWEETDMPMWQIEISGLEGGHSGGAISRQGGNALVIAGVLLNTLLPSGGRVGRVSGGEKDNVIPNRAELEFAFLSDPSSLLEPVIRQIQDSWRETDPNLQISCKPLRSGKVLSAGDGRALAELLQLLPHGVLRCSSQTPGLPETSANLAAVKTGEQLELQMSIRSSVDFQKELVMQKIRVLANLYGARCTFDGVYPGWSFTPQSRLRTLAERAFQTVYGYSPQIQGIHAGLECGVLKEAIPDLDIIATGPKYGAMHTTAEWMDIASITRIHDFIKELLRIFSEETVER